MIEIPTDLHPSLVPLAFLLGRWAGAGVHDFPVAEKCNFGQEVAFSHDGRPFLSYESRSWLIEEDGTPIRPAAREQGWWRPVLADGKATDEVEVLLTHPTGIMELYVGRVDGLKVELVTDAVVRTVTAKEVTAGQRLYGIVEGALLYAQEMAAVGQPMSPHLSARLLRVAG